MNSPLSLLMAIILLSLLTGCEKEPERMDDYLVDFATLQKEGTEYRFRLDNNRIVIPTGVDDYKGNEGQRVILNYVPLNGDTIQIRRISDIFTDVIQEDGFPERYTDDPVKIQSVWVGGDYLNMIMEIEYHSLAHKVSLLRDPSSASVDLWFSHSRNNDPHGYPQMMYASFSLQSLHPGSNGTIPLRLFINTHTGMREFHFELK